MPLTPIERATEMTTACLPGHVWKKYGYSMLCPIYKIPKIPYVGVSPSDVYTLRDSN